jgi:plasmid maintenance system killer protein
MNSSEIERISKMIFIKLDPTKIDIHMINYLSVISDLKQSNVQQNITFYRAIGDVSVMTVNQNQSQNVALSKNKQQSQQKQQNIVLALTMIGKNKKLEYKLNIELDLSTKQKQRDSIIILGGIDMNSHLLYDHRYNNLFILDITNFYFFLIYNPPNIFQHITYISLFNKDHYGASINEEHFINLRLIGKLIFSNQKIQIKFTIEDKEKINSQQYKEFAKQFQMFKVIENKQIFDIPIYNKYLKYNNSEATSMSINKEKYIKYKEKYLKLKALMKKF